MQSLSQPFNPNGKFKTIWDIVILVFVLYESVFIPFQIGFEIDLEGRMLIFDIVKDIFFMLDVMLTFHTAIILKEKIITSHIKIAINYAKKWFIFDIISMLASRWATIFELILNEDDWNSLKSYIVPLRLLRTMMLLRILRVRRLRKILTKMKGPMVSDAKSGFMSLLKLFLSVTFLAHWVACFWHLIGTVVNESMSNSWLKDSGFLYQPLGERYVASFYWTITTMITVGYGDITPVTFPERIVNILIMLLGCAVFAYSMNSIGMLLQTMNEKAFLKRQKYYVINKYMKRKKLSKPIQEKVHQYLDYLFESQNEAKSQENAAISNLSDGIQEQIKKEINGKILKENILFQSIFGTKFLTRVSDYLEEKIYSPNEIIYDEYDTQFSIFFIYTGSVELYYTLCKQSLKMIHKGEYFGELSFFTGHFPTTAAKSVAFTTAFLLRKKQFYQILEDYPIEKETFHFTQDKVVLYKDYQLIKLRCFGCEKDGHDASQCPNLHYIPDTPTVIQNYLQEEQNFRSRFVRKRVNKFKTIRGQKHKNAIFNYFLQNKVWIAKKFFIPSPVTTNLRESLFENGNKAKTKVQEEQSEESEEDSESESDIGRSLIKASKSPFRKAQTRMQAEKYEKSGESKFISIILTNKSYSLANLALMPVENEDNEKILFDAVKNYSIYFPHNNITKMIEMIEQQQAKKTKLKGIKNQVHDLRMDLEKFLPRFSTHGIIPLSQPAAVSTSKSCTVK